MSEEDGEQPSLVLATQQPRQSFLVNFGEGVVGWSEECDGRELGECLVSDVGGLDGGHQAGEPLVTGEGADDGGGARGRDGDGVDCVVSPPSSN